MCEHDVHEYIIDNDMDVFCLKEMWLKEKGDEVLLSQMTHPGYPFINSPRPTGWGGRIAIIHKFHLILKSTPTQHSFVSFECHTLTLSAGKLSYLSAKLIWIYCPSWSKKKNIYKNSTLFFFEEFSLLRTDVSVSCENDCALPWRLQCSLWKSEW